MQFLPTSRERYYAALRRHIHRRIMKYGINDDILKELKKLRIAELMSGSRESIAVNLEKYTDILLGSAVLTSLRRGCWFTTRIMIHGWYLVDIAAYSALLLESASLCARYGGEVSVYAVRGGVIITVKGKYPRCTRTLVKKFGGQLLYELISVKSALLIPADSCPPCDGTVPCETEFIADRLSDVSIFLSEL